MLFVKLFLARTGDSILKPWYTKDMKIEELKDFLKQMENPSTATKGNILQLLDNMLFLESGRQLCFVKPADCDAQKTKSSQIRHIENICYAPQEDEAEKHAAENVSL